MWWQRWRPFDLVNVYGGQCRKLHAMVRGCSASKYHRIYCIGTVGYVWHKIQSRTKLRSANKWENFITRILTHSEPTGRPKADACIIGLLTVAYTTVYHVYVLLSLCQAIVNLPRNAQSNQDQMISMAAKSCFSETSPRPLYIKCSWSIVISVSLSHILIAFRHFNFLWTTSAASVKFESDVLMCRVNT